MPSDPRALSPLRQQCAPPWVLVALGLLAVALPCPSEPAADKAPAVPVTQPRRTAQDFQLTLRQIRESPADASTPAPARWTDGGSDAPAPLQVRVRNGEPAHWRLQWVQPLQWTTSMQAQTLQMHTDAGTATGAGGALTQGLYLVQSGQELRVTPIATATRAAVRLDVEVRSQQTDARLAQELPSSHSQVLSTTVTATVGQWVTLASSGAPSPRGTYRSDAAQRERWLLQIQVNVP